MGWGASWGDVFGGGLSAATVAPLYLVSTVATTTRSVRVVFSTVPVFGSYISGLGDAANPDNWDVTNVDTGASLRVVFVESIDSVTVALYTLLPFDASTSTYRVTAMHLLSDAGLPLTAPNALDFLGAPWVHLGAIQQDLVDIQNPAVPSTSTGALFVGSDGDYAVETGDALVRKLILRRVITVTGGFRFNPAYGVGLPEKVTYTVAGLVKLRAEVEKQVLQEPEVSAVSATITSNTASVLTIALAVKLKKSNTSMTISYTPSNLSVAL